VQSWVAGLCTQTPTVSVQSRVAGYLLTNCVATNQFRLTRDYLFSVQILSRDNDVVTRYSVRLFHHSKPSAQLRTKR